MQLAAAAMQWPDMLTQIRAVAACRTFAAAAGAPMNPVGMQCGVSGAGGSPTLQPLLVPCILHQAVRALASADGPHVASELLLLIRSIYIAAAALQPSPGAQIRQLLPSISDEAMAKVRQCALALQDACHLLVGEFVVGVHSTSQHISRWAGQSRRLDVHVARAV